MHTLIHVHVHVYLLNVKHFNFCAPSKVNFLKMSLSGDVQPLLCIVRLEKEQQFDAKFKEAYPYDTVGGNNSRCALQELLKEHPELRNNKLYTHR